MDPITAAALGKASGKSVEWLLGILTDKLKSKFDEKQLKLTVENLYYHARRIRLTRVLANRYEDSDLDDFFVPPMFHLNNVSTSMRANSVSLIPVAANVLIQAGPGQGKSTYIKHLCSNEMMTGEYLPIFIELRRIESIESFTDAVNSYFNEINLPSFSKEELISLYKNGKIYLFLDGFDEVKPDFRDELLFFIQEFSNLQTASKIVLTSRHDSGAENLIGFSTVRICRPNKEMILEIINKIYATFFHGSQDYKLQLINDINNQGIKTIEQLIISPLIVMMLTVSYQSGARFTEDSSDFFQDLFDCLLLGHDKLKLGFNRALKSHLDAKTFKELFTNLCFRLHADFPQGLYSEKQLISTIETLLSTKHSTVQPQQLLSDIVNNTGFIFKEGKDYSFIHNNIREFFAASYITSRPTTVKENFFPKISPLLGMSTVKWNNVIHFIKKIDNLSWLKYIEKPRLENIILNMNLDLKSGNPESTISNKLSSSSLIFSYKIDRFEANAYSYHQTEHYLQTYRHSVYTAVKECPQDIIKNMIKNLTIGKTENRTTALPPVSFKTLFYESGLASIIMKQILLDKSNLEIELSLVNKEISAIENEQLIL